MEAQQFLAVYGQIAPAMQELFNEGGGLNPRMMWAKLESPLSTELRAAGEAADPMAVERLFKEGTAASLMPMMVQDLMLSACLPEDLGGGAIDAVVVAGETTILNDRGESQEALGIWIHSLDRTEWGSLPISVVGGRRECSMAEIVISEGGRTGPFTMRPEGQKAA